MIFGKYAYALMAVVTISFLDIASASASGGGRCDLEVELECAKFFCEAPYSGLIVSSSPSRTTISDREIVSDASCSYEGDIVDIPADQAPPIALDGFEYDYVYSWHYSWEYNESLYYQSGALGCSTASQPMLPDGSFMLLGGLLLLVWGRREGP